MSISSERLVDIALGDGVAGRPGSRAAASGGRGRASRILRGRAGRVLALLGGVTSVALITSFVTFAVTSASSANPAALIADPASGDAGVRHVEHLLGLDRPFLVRYADWLGSVLHGDFGSSYFSHIPVGTEVVQRIPVDLGVTSVAVTLAVIFGFSAGIVSASFRGRLVDRIITGVCSLAFTVPEFWLGILLVLLFAVRLGVLPASGWVALHDDPRGWLEHVLLPGLSLSIPIGAMLARQLRTALVGVYEQNYVTGALVRGLSPRRILLRHALRNALAPSVAALGLAIPYFLSGAVVVEQIFSLPGLGQYAIGGAMSQDTPIIQGVLMVTIAIVVLSNLAVDFLLGWLRPGTRV
ncbi:MAG: peptide/nickel transport system permease protein [Gaiellales bacterium]|jgi:peptide/nickel transport system permease protein|nr:peptide/nickel transport system permease protein [Gaiellales bacterium]